MTFFQFVQWYCWISHSWFLIMLHCLLLYRYIFYNMFKCSIKIFHFIHMSFLCFIKLQGQKPSSDDGQIRERMDLRNDPKNFTQDQTFLSSSIKYPLRSYTLFFPSTLCSVYILPPIVFGIHFGIISNSINISFQSVFVI